MFAGCRKWALTNGNSILLSIIMLAGALRGFYLFHGVGFHPDERGIQMITSNISWSNLNPKNFHYGSFAYYLCWFTAKFLSIFWSGADSYDFRFSIGRYLAVLFGSLAVAGIYKLAKLLSFDYRIPIIAAFILATNVFHLQLSRFYTVDILLTTICVVAIYCCCRIVDDSSYHRYFAIALALAFTNKISALTLLVPYLVAIAPKLFSKSNFSKTIIYGLEVCLISGLTVLIVEPFLFLDFEQFIADNKTQIDMVKGSWVPPYTLQYVGTAPYLYHLKQMFYYTLGLPLAPLVLLGLLFVVLDLRSNLNHKHLIMLSWFCAVFFSIAGMQVKFPRYLLPLYPLLSFFGAYGLIGFIERFRILRKNSLIVTSAVLVLFLLQAISWIGIYSKPHVYFTASEWIYENIPAHSKLAEMHWDDRLPLELSARPANTYQYLEVPIYEREERSRIDNLLNMISSADYLVFPSGRPYGAFPHVAKQYPFAMDFFKKLFTGQLGYKLVSKFKVKPWFSYLQFNDELADESFSLYDHPKVTIFKNELKLSQAELAKLMEQSSNSTERDLEMFLLH